ncbi:Carbonyl reductase [NADPH] 1, partial [Bienertia sinuspersici]
WWGKETIAIVTGGNRGIGFAVTKRLAELGITVIFTARDEKKGIQALELLRNYNEASFADNIHFYLLDISDPLSISAFASWFNLTFGLLDILNVKNQSIRAILEDEENLTEERIEGVINLFLKHVKEGKWENEGWPNEWTDYSVSKLALNAYSKMLARRLRDKNIAVNCFCPGFTKTGMTGGIGSRTADIAGDVGAKLALLPPQCLDTGKFTMGKSLNLHSRF